MIKIFFKKIKPKQFFRVLIVIKAKEKEMRYYEK